MTGDQSRREKEKQAREAEIVDAAERIFFAKGFDGASMDAIAREARFTKRTLYQYFDSKEGLYFAVALKWFNVLISYFDEALKKGSNGYEKFYLAGAAYFRFSKDYPDAFRLLNSCKGIKTDPDADGRFQAMARLKYDMFQKLAAAVEEGRRDGSIRQDLDPMMGAYAGVYLSIGFLNFVLQQGENLPGDGRVEKEALITYGFQLIAAAFRPGPD